jgi:hypothetical protein
MRTPKDPLDVFVWLIEFAPTLIFERYKQERYKDQKNIREDFTWIPNPDYIFYPEDYIYYPDDSGK